MSNIDELIEQFRAELAQLNEECEQEEREIAELQQLDAEHVRNLAQGEALDAMFAPGYFDDKIAKLAVEKDELEKIREEKKKELTLVTAEKHEKTKEAERFQKECGDNLRAMEKEIFDLKVELLRRGTFEKTKK